MKVHAAIAASLVDHDVTTLFGVVGDANLFIVDRYVADHGMKYVATSNEAGAVLMASGYASVSGRLGVATVTHGPALTNTMTALVEAVRSNLPILLLAGDTPVENKYHFQNIDQREVVAATGAGFEQARSVATVIDDLATAVHRALHERRPIVFNIPTDFQWQEFDYSGPAKRPVIRQAVAPDADVLDQAVGIIASAKRPIVLAGLGAASPEGRASLLRLAERIGAPLASTLKASGLFRGEPYDLGVFGTLSMPEAVETIMESDCIVAFGASLNRWTTADGSYLSGKRVIHCDSDPTHLGRYANVDTPVLGDLAVTADTIVQWYDEAGIEPTAFRSTALAERLDGVPDSDFRDASSADSVDIRTALRHLNTVVPSDRVLVTDGGRFFYQAVKFLKAPDPRSFVITVSFGSIGLGMGTAIGASFAAAGRPTLLVTGDGGFMLGGLAEFNTAVRNKSDLIVVVCNDGSYGAEHFLLSAREMDPGLTLFDWPELAEVADALGGQGVTVRTLADLEALGETISSRVRPLLIDIKLDPNQVPNEAHDGAQTMHPA